MRKIKTVPLDIISLFSEYELNDFDLDLDKDFVIEIVLENSTPERLKWLFANYELDDVRNVVINSEYLDIEQITIWDVEV